MLLFSGCQSDPETSDWPVYKADTYSSSYSELDQVNKNNVDRLQEAWVYKSDDLEEGRYATIETNPIVVDGVLYGGTPNLNVFALDAQTGEELWMYRPFPEDPPRGYMRAVTYWEDGSDKRIFFSAGIYLFGLNAHNGELIEDFGAQGKINLNENLGRDPASIQVKSPSPGIIYEDLIIMGSATGESYGSAPGHIRAYDVRTGSLEWIFHTIPQPGQFGYETWEQVEGEQEIAKGGVNNWAGMSLDSERGIVYVPLGSPTYDFYGGDRPGKNLFGNALVALDAATGERIWHYQTIHHDIWDYDLPSPPNLVTVERNGKKIDAVAQVTKTGFTFVFDRETGEPLYDIEERPVPQSNIESEHDWPTQPHPTAPEPFVRQNFSRDQITDLSQESHDSVLAEFEKLRNDGFFTPPDPGGSVYLPSSSGGANWGGAAHDPETGILYINANEIPEYSTVKKVLHDIVADGSFFEQGKTFYYQQCATCHGTNLEGRDPDYPALHDVSQRMNKEEVLSIMEDGGGRMPAFTHLSEEEKEAILAFLYNEREAVYEGSGKEMETAESGQYLNVTAYQNFEDPEGYPAIKPPWATLNAVNLNTGEIEWKVPLGTYPELLERGIPPTGSETYGGPILTAGGLIFIGGTEDGKFRAFDKDTGEILWETTLPTAGFATPSTYMIDGRQYVVISAGGGRGAKPGDYYVAFTLPN
ncbi:PQQ-binding-like beta-propeller repeat protein [Halalkalibaculum sp. DA3122]|uniref:outer membrane protein assembly factor BamB family protein n=1 Tax=Halalkalibaculum sp. DA3122 TaxID=3373607 RepID=UPI0037551BFF